MLRRAWRSTIGRVARRGGAPGASAAAYGGGGAGTVASSYLECVERLRTCVQSLDRDVTAGWRASLRVARAVRGAAEDCLAGSRGGAARRGGDVQVACAVAELRKVADALVVEIERRGALGFSEEPEERLPALRISAHAALRPSPCPGRGAAVRLRRAMDGRTDITSRIRRCSRGRAYR